MSPPFFGFAKSAENSDVASFNFNLLYTVGRSDCITLSGRLPGFFRIYLIVMIEMTLEGQNYNKFCIHRPVIIVS